MLKIFCTNMPIIPPSNHTHNSVAFHYVLEVPLKMMSKEGVLSFANRLAKLDNAEVAEPIAQEIEKCPKLLVLELKGNTVGVKAGERLAAAIAQHPELQRCLWSDMFTGRLKTEIPPILKSMCGAMMRANCQIVELDLSDNAFGPIGAEGISDFLKSSSAFSLEVLKLNNNGLGAGGKIVASCLEECYDNAKRSGRSFQLKTFIAGRNRLEDPGAKALSKAFKKIGSLEEIIIYQNGIRSDGITALAESLKYNPNLRVINFNDNTCTATGAKAVAAAVKGLLALEVLDLGDSLCRKGAIDVISALTSGDHVKLKSVDLSGGELSSADAEHIISLWKGTFKSNVSLSLTNNCFGSSFIDLVSEVLGTGISLGNESDDEGTLSATEESDEDDGELNSDVDSDMDLEEPQKPKSHTLGMDDLLAGVNKLNVEQEEVVSFLDKQYKLNTASDAELVCSVIDKAPTMHTLILRGNTVGVPAGERIGQSLLKHPELKRCLWSDMFTGRLKTEIPPILKSMCGAMMRANCQIVELDLSDNAFGPIGAEGISDFLKSSSAFSLEVLKLNNNGLGAGGKIVASCLEECYDNAKRSGRSFQLKTFIAGRNRLEDPGAKALSKAFKKIGSLEEIIIYQNGIRSDGITALAESLKYNPNLRVINFNDNTCTATGAKAVAAAVKGLLALEVLDLGDSLCRKGAIDVISALTSGDHVKLKSVDLSGGELSSADAEHIISLWKGTFKSNVSLSLTNNCFGSSFIDLVSEVLGTGISLGNESDDEGTLSATEESDEDDGELNSDVDSDMDLEEPQKPKSHTLGMDDLLAGVNKLNVEQEEVVSFLDKQYKLNTASDAELVCSVIDKAPTMHTLILRGNTVGVPAGERIGQSLLKHPELKRCLWSDMFTGRLKTEIPPILKSMCGAMMRANCQIVELDLSDNAFGPIGAEGISDFLKSSSAFSLEVLKLNNNGLGAGGKIVASCLEECYDNAKRSGRSFQLKTFIAGRNRLEDPGAKALSKAFKKIGSLEEIIIYQNGIRSDGITALAESLKYNPNLRVINFNDNTCTATGAKAVAAAVKGLLALEVLDLGDSLCRKGAIDVISALTSGDHVKLKSVDLSGGELSSADAEHIISLWKGTFKSNVSLSLTNNCFGSSFIDLVSEVLGTGISLGNESDDEGTLSATEESDEDDGELNSDVDSDMDLEEPQKPKSHTLGMDDLLADVNKLNF